MTENKNERIYLQLYDYETKEFSGLTTYHGLVRIYNSNTWPSRIFWSVVVLSCLSLFMIHSGYLLLGYHAKPTLFQINTMVPTNGLVFPEVTICNLNPIDLSKVKKLNMSDSVLSYIMHFFNEISDPQTTTENEHNEYMQFTENYKNTTGRIFDVRNFFAAVSKTCEESIVSCSFGRHKIANCCENVVTELTENGICFRISNKNQTNRQWFSGDGFGWELVLNGNNKIDEVSSFPSHDSEHGFAVMVHEPDKYPKISSFAFSVSPDAMLHASISLKNISLLDKANWGSCSVGWQDNTTSLPYTANHCENQCKLKQVKSLCNCAPLAYSARNLTMSQNEFCSPFEISKCYEQMRSEIRWEDSCHCASECNLLEFEIANSYSHVPERTKRVHNFEDSQLEQDISIVSLFFRHVSYERHEQQKQLQTADLLSNIAGSMGLFLGMSTVTLLEIFIYLFKSVWGTVNSTRQKQFMEAVAEDEKERQQSIVIIQNNGSEERENLTSTTRLTRDERKYSGNSIHIHLDRRNSRMLRGGDLFSAPRGSVSIPSQLLSPLSKHNRQSISVGALGRKTSTLGLTLSNTLSDFGEPRSHKKSQIRRSSTLSPPTFQRKRDSSASQPEAGVYQPTRKVSTQSMFKSQLI